MSFGNEAEEDEQESTDFIQKIPQKGKSTHDVLDDPKLSKEVSKEDGESSKKEERGHGRRKRKGTPPPGDIEAYEYPVETEEQRKEKAERIKNKLKRAAEPEKKKKETIRPPVVAAPVDPEISSSSEEEDYLNNREKERRSTKLKKVEEIKKEINSLKKQYKADKLVKTIEIEKEKAAVVEKEQQNEMMKDYLSEKEKYTKLRELPKKGSSREQFTLSLLNKFKAKLDSAKEARPTDKDSTKTSNDDDITDDNWLSHELHFVEQGAILAKDAATKQDDWYDVYDPRNPINKRRRGDDKKKKGGSSSGGAAAAGSSKRND